MVSINYEKFEDCAQIRKQKHSAEINFYTFHKIRGQILNTPERSLILFHSPTTTPPLRSGAIPRMCQRHCSLQREQKTPGIWRAKLKFYPSSRVQNNGTHSHHNGKREGGKSSRDRNL